MISVPPDPQLAVRAGSHAITSSSVLGRVTNTAPAARSYYSNAFVAWAREVSVPECVFCRIVTHQSPADILYEDEAVVAFKDIYPKAPVHVLIVPRRHIPSIGELEPADADVIGRCFLVARQLGEMTGFAHRGYRISVNCGPEGGQVVYHVHFHFTAGRLRAAPG